MGRVRYVKTLDANGFNTVTKLHYHTADYFDPEGYDIDGFNENGIDREGYNREGYDGEGHDRRGFDKNGVNKDTRTEYDVEGYNQAGYDIDGYNKEGFNNNGFNRVGIHQKTGTAYDRAGYDKDGFNNKGFNRQGINRDTNTLFDMNNKDKDGYNIEGYDEQGLDRFGLDNEGRNTEGEIDKRVLFVREFIESKLTMAQFASLKGQPVEEIAGQIDSCRGIACTRDALNKALEDNSNRYLFAMNADKEKILSGEIPIREVKNIDSYMRFCSEEEKDTMLKLLSTEISSHSISIIEYKDLFDLGKIDYALPSRIVERLNGINQTVKRSKDSDIKKSIKEIYSEIRRVEGYKKPYREGDLKNIGYIQEDGERAMMPVTQENEQLARDYLMASHEFICYKTMSSTLMKIAKGEITAETIEKPHGHNLREIADAVEENKQIHK